MKNVNPALKIANFIKFSEKVFLELNFARTNPGKYVQKLANALENINDNILNIHGYGMQLLEGKEAFAEAITFLRSQESLPELIFSEGINKSSDELLSHLILHDGITMQDIEKNNYDLEKRMNHYGAAFGELDELIDYGTFDPEYVIINFIVCDGDSDRKERRIIFNENIKYVGMACGLLPSDKVCSVLNFAEYFFNPGELVPDYIVKKFKGNLNYDKHNARTVKRRTSANLYKEKENRYRNVLSDEWKGHEHNQQTLHRYQHHEGTINLAATQDRSYNDDQGHEAFKSQVIAHDEEDDSNMDIPEGVDKIKFIEKQVLDKTTNTMRTIVKKIVYYSDGNCETTIYKK